MRNIEIEKDYKAELDANILFYADNNNIDLHDARIKVLFFKRLINTLTDNLEERDIIINKICFDNSKKDVSKILREIRGQFNKKDRIPKEPMEKSIGKGIKNEQMNQIAYEEKRENHYDNLIDAIKSNERILNLLKNNKSESAYYKAGYFDYQNVKEFYNNNIDQFN